mgnify:CR=1 FL=1
MFYYLLTLEAYALELARFLLYLIEILLLLFYLRELFSELINDYF